MTQIAPAPAPACAKRLVLRECIDQRQREAQFGECDTGRYRCRYVVWGHGPTLVLIPGMASDALSFVMLMARLQTRFRCVSYDLPDGISDGARLMSYRHVDLVGDLFALLDHLHVRESVVFGSSFGSTVALAALNARPERFTHGILQGGFAHRPIATMEILAASFARFLPGRVAHLPLMRHVLERNEGARFRERGADVWDFFLAQTGKVPLRAFATRVLMLHHLDLRPILPTIRMPMLVACGDNDPLVGKSCEADLMHGLPNVARAEIEQCGHESALTHPEVLTEAILEWYDYSMRPSLR